MDLTEELLTPLSPRENSTGELQDDPRIYIDGPLEDTTESKSAWGNAALSCIYWSRFGVLLGWFCMLCLGLSFGHLYTRLSYDAVEAPLGTVQQEAQDMFRTRFPTRSEELPLLIVASCSRERAFCDVRTDGRLLGFYREIKNLVLGYNNTHNNIIKMESYYEYKGTMLDAVKDSFVNAIGSVTYINIVVRGSNSTKSRYNFVNKLEEWIEQYNPNVNAFNIGLTGLDALGSQNSKQSMQDIGRVNEFVIVTAFLLVAFSLRSWRLCLVIIFNVAASVLSSYAVLALAVEHLGAPRPQQGTLQLQQSVSLAVAIVFNLVLLRQFKHEVGKTNKHADDATRRAMINAGHFVILSGATLLMDVGAYLVLPSPSIRMDGVACLVSIAMCTLVAVTNTPAFLFTFPTFFSQVNSCSYCIRKCGSEHLNYHIEVDMDDDSDSDNGEVFSPRSQDKRRTPSARFWVTKWFTTYPCNIIAVVVVLAIVIPFALQAKNLEVNESILARSQRNSEPVHYLKEFYKDFNGGVMSPFYVLINTPDKKHIVNQNVFDPTVFAAAESISAMIIKHTACNDEDVKSPAFFQGNSVSPLTAKRLLYTASSSSCTKGGQMSNKCKYALEYSQTFERCVNKNKTSMLIEIVAPFLPFDQRKTGFIDQVQSILDSESTQHSDDRQSLLQVPANMQNSPVNLEASKTMPLDFYLVGFEVGVDSLMHEACRLFPVVFAITIVIVVLVLSISLKSCFAAVPLLFTTLLPVASVYATAVAVYQHGALDHLGIDALAKADGLYWYVPILVTTLTFGITLIYDLFLMLVVMQYRSRGYDIQASVVYASCEVGNTVLACGLIMMVVFGGLLLSEQGTVNQVGMLLTTGVFCNAFIVCPILLPAVLSISDKYAWKPLTIPRENLKSLE